MAALSDDFLNTLVAELDRDIIVGMALRGSYAREETTPYSDVDIACFVEKEADLPQNQYEYLYRNGLLISIAYKALDRLRRDLQQPAIAIFAVPGLRQCRLLLDKKGMVEQLVREAASFRWEPLQQAAYEQASAQMMHLAEWAHKILSERLKGNETAQALATAEFLMLATRSVALRYGVLIKSEGLLYQQVQEFIGMHSAWVRYLSSALGVEMDGTESGRTTIRTRALAALHLYRETLALLCPVMLPDHRAVAEQTLRMIEESLPAFEQSNFIKA